MWHPKCTAQHRWQYYKIGQHRTKLHTDLGDGSSVLFWYLCIVVQKQNLGVTSWKFSHLLSLEVGWHKGSDQSELHETPRNSEFYQHSVLPILTPLYFGNKYHRFAVTKLNNCILRNKFFDFISTESKARTCNTSHFFNEDWGKNSFAELENKSVCTFSLYVYGFQVWLELVSHMILQTWTGPATDSLLKALGYAA